VLHRQLLIDIASAGDFAKTNDRRAARASMTIDAYADPERSPIAERLTGSYDAQCVALYEETLPLLISIATEGERFRDLWADEDAELTSSERLIADRTVTIEETSRHRSGGRHDPGERADPAWPSLRWRIVRRHSSDGAARRDGSLPTARRPRSSVPVRRPLRNMGASTDRDRRCRASTCVHWPTC
jgi:hypothetical protein